MLSVAKSVSGAVTVERIEQALQPLRNSPEKGPLGHEKGAGVAIVLAGRAGAPSICFIERVERAGDRWSGDVAFPGGWAQDDDGGLKFTAMRETFEEVGIELSLEQHIACLPTSSIPAARAGSTGYLGASVFYVGEAIPRLTPDPKELADAFWVPCSHLADSTNATTIDWAGSDMPAVEFDRRIIWGLTHRVLREFFTLVGQIDAP